MLLIERYRANENFAAYVRINEMAKGLFKIIEKDEVREIELLKEIADLKGEK